MKASTNPVSGVFNISSGEPLTFEGLYNHYFKYLLSLFFELIKFDNVPDTISQEYLKLCIYCFGKVTFFKDDNGTLLALNASPSKIEDVYYVPSGMIVSNPRLSRSYDLTRGVDCEVVYCMSLDRYPASIMSGGVWQLINKTATMLADNDISINVAQKNTRLINVLGADDSIAVATINDIMRKMYAGQPFTAVQTRYLNTLQSVPVQTNVNNQQIVQLIELKQYILSHFYECIGLTTHDNMKKERLITAEIADNQDLVLYNIQNIYNSIAEGIERVNKMFGTDIQVSINTLLLPKPEQEPEPEPEPEPEAEPEPEPEQEPEPEPEQKIEIKVEISGDDNTVTVNADPAEKEAVEDAELQSEDMG